MKITNIVFDMAAEEVKSLVMDEFIKENPDCTMEDLADLGITMNESVAKLNEYIAAMDAAPNTQTTPSNVTPVQFAQYWLEKPIKILTRARSLDKVVGRTITGTWETEQIVATILERIGQPGLYGDFTKAPLANWNVNFETRDNVRFEVGVQVGKLEEACASQMRLNAYSLKREAAAEAIDILLNNVGWFGYRSSSLNFPGTSKNVYGLLNDPNVTAAIAIGRTTWAAASMDNIVTDIQAMVRKAVQNLKGHYDPETDTATLALPIDQYVQLGVINAYGISVRDWLTKTYPKIRVVACAELNGAISDSDAALFIVDKVVGDNAVQQLLTSAMRLVGVQPLAKGFYEVYSASTGGALVRYPLGYTIWKFTAS